MYRNQLCLTTLIMSSVSAFKARLHGHRVTGPGTTYTGTGCNWPGKSESVNLNPGRVPRPEVLQVGFSPAPAAGGRAASESTPPESIISRTPGP
jgi:hypothetical protein